MNRCLIETRNSILNGHVTVCMYSHATACTYGYITAYTYGHVTLCTHGHTFNKLLITLQYVLMGTLQYVPSWRCKEKGVSLYTLSYVHWGICTELLFVTYWWHYSVQKHQLSAYAGICYTCNDKDMISDDFTRSDKVHSWRPYLGMPPNLLISTVVMTLLSCICTYLYACMHTYTQTHGHTDTRTNAHTDIYIYIHTHTHTHKKTRQVMIWTMYYSKQHLHRFDSISNSHLGCAALYQRHIHTMLHQINVTFTRYFIILMSHSHDVASY